MALSDKQLLLLDNLIYLDGIKNNKSVKQIVDSALDNLDTLTASKPANMGKEEWNDLLLTIRADKTLSNYKVQNYTTDSTGFRAACFNQGEDVNVIFRGTGGSYEWKDNGEGGYLPDTKSQQIAADYINSLPESYGNQITVSGHSKGGNKAQYVTIVTDRVGKCLSYDGQGFSPEFLDKYSEQIDQKKDLITSISAKSDLVNSLLFSIAGTKIYLEESSSVDPITAHTPNVIFDENYDLMPTSDQSGLAVLLNKFSTYLVSHVEEPERSFIIDCLLSIMAEGASIKSFAQLVIGGIGAISHIDDFVLESMAEIMAEYYGIPIEAARTLMLIIEEPVSNLVKLAVAITAVTAIGVGIMEFGKKVFEEFIEAGTLLLNKLSEFGGKLVEIAQVIEQAFSDFAEGAAEWWKDTVESITKTVNDFVESITGKDIVIDEEAFQKASDDLTALSGRMQQLRGDVENMLDTLKTGFDTPAGRKFYNSCHSNLVLPLEQQKVVLDHIAQVLKQSRSKYQSVFDAYRELNGSITSYAV
jgi:hypothetical protein